MPTYRLSICYDGTDFCGWQRQKNGPSVQAVLEEALSSLCKEPVSCQGAGRTDSGVHALGQVVSIKLSRAFPEKALLYGTNNHLPKSVVVLSAELVSDDFDARHSASGKLYRYQIWNRKIRSPLHDRTHWHVSVPLDLLRMQEAATVLLGKHDFRAFRASTCDRHNTVRTMKRIDVFSSMQEPASVYIEVEGTAFLRNMVRIFSGTLVAVGKGQMTAEQVRQALASGARSQAGSTAPAHGLLLVRVDYGPRTET
ncbi:MAG TPA: tRNA pseudouridine(38-40) synthase TruA [Pseudomonadota bacterium]|nr:tRNA pseudouridine(38-40) synthase TruA [Pseudomonadota bacterium]